jgi:integrase
MACVFRRKAKWIDKDGVTQLGKTSTYYARFDVDGKHYCISTGKTVKSQAEQELKRLVALHRGELRIHDQFNILRVLLKAAPSSEQLEQEGVVVRRNFLTDHFEPLLFELIHDLPQTEREGHCKELAKQLMAGQKNKLQITEGWKNWKESPNKRRTPKESTELGYYAIWKRFQGWAAVRGLEHFHDVREKDARDYATDLWKSHVSPATFNAHIKFLTSAFSLLDSEAGLSENVWRKITRKENEQAGKRNLNQTELQKVFERSTGNRRVMFAIGLFTGLRLGDVVNLRWDEIDRDRFKGEPKPGFIVVLPMKVERRGRDKKVELPIHLALRSVLDEHKSSANKDDYLFPGERQLYAENSSNITEGIQEFFESCGIKTTEKAANGERRRAIVRVGFHSLRHSFVSLCAKAGAPQHIVQRLVGHGSPAMTEHYTHLDDQQKREAIAHLPSVLTEPATNQPGSFDI